MWITRQKISTRLLLNVVVAAVALMALSGFALTQLRSLLTEDRAVKTQHVVETAHGMITHYAQLAQSGAMTEDEAKKAALAAIANLRYGGKEYFFVQDINGVMLMHPIAKQLIGQDRSNDRDPTGKLFNREMVELAKTKGEGFVEYMWPKPGEKEPSPKLSYLKAFKPWGWFVSTGTYVDDIDAVFRDMAIVLGGTTLVILVVLGGISMLIGRSVTGPLSRISTGMLRLADGDKSIEIADTDQKNEIGDLSRAMQVFLNKTIEMDEMRAAQDAAEKRAEEEKRAMMVKMADEFEASIGQVVNQVSSAATQLRGSAESMTRIAESTANQSATVSTASETTSNNVQTVAAATEELSSSIAEIGRQVARASSVAGGAVQQANETNAKIQQLAEAADKIGEVVSLITDIAEQTNLLALNATIEAARAGDAGKGFAVVASEVKNLANQTAKATEEIAAQIGSVQTSTSEAVAAIEAITGTISEVDEIASAIAAAVEEQAAATQEIARNVEEASNGAGEVSRTIVGVNQAANDTGVAAHQIKDASGELSEQSERLRAEVATFLDNIRVA